MSFLVDSLTSRPASLTPPNLLPNLLAKRKNKNINRVSFRLTPQIRFKERTPSVSSNSSRGLQVDFKEIILESQVISFEHAMELVRSKAAEEEKRTKLAITMSTLNSSPLLKPTRSESNLKLNSDNSKVKHSKSERKSAQLSGVSAKSSARLSASKTSLNENEELKKLNLKMRLKEEKRLRELDEENRRRAEREAFLEKEKKNRLLLQKKVEEEKKKKEKEERNRYFYDKSNFI